MSFEISKELTIEMGHRLPNHDGRCRNLHGHSYSLELFCVSTNLYTYGHREGMVEDYHDLKKAMAPIDAIFDHALVLCVDDPILIALMSGSRQENHDYIKRVKELPDVFTTFSGTNQTRLVVVRHPPTAEVLGAIWLFLMKRMFDELTKDNTSCVTKLVVRETATSSASIDTATRFEEYALNWNWRKSS